MAKILGVIYRKIITLLPPMQINNTVYVDLSWTPLKLTTFIIALALQTHGKDEQTASTITTTHLGSEWQLTPSDAKIQFTYKRTSVTVNDDTITYPTGLTVAHFGFESNNAIHLNFITTELWRTMVKMLSP
jgi:hypothetical protein